MKDPFFSVRTDADGSHIVFINPETGVEAKSKIFETRQLAMKGIAAVRENCEAEANYSKLMARNEQLYFELKDKSGNVLLTSVMFNSHLWRLNIIQALINHGREAQVY